MKKKNLDSSHLTLLIPFLIIFITSCNQSNTTKKQILRPNIILFLVDDMGWQDTSVPFWYTKTDYNKRYNTPGMERLASEGMMFTQAYASSVCSPTRVSLMSGMNAARHRVTNWTLQKNVSVDAKSDILDYPQWNVNGVQPCDTIERSAVATLLPQILHDNGYFTIHAGKAHFGAMGTPSANPLNCGFDINIAGHAAGGLGSYLGEQNFGNKKKGGHTLPWGVPGLEKYHGDIIFITEALTIEAKKAMEKAINKKQPFYLYMAHYAVHIPLNADRRFYQKYIKKGLPESEAKYASMIESMDKSLVDIMSFLDKKNINDNTIIIFMSDNGGFSLRPRSGKQHTHNKPLNSGKGSAYEGGIREPMIVKWPGVVQQKSRSNELIIIEDFFPTILELANIDDYKTIQKIDGKSFINILKGDTNKVEPRDLFWHFPNNWGPTGPGIGATSTIRSGKWKLIYWHKNQTFELFNIDSDIGEQHDVSLDNPFIVKTLAKKLADYLRSVNAQRPILKETNQPIPWPDEVLTGKVCG